MATKKEKFSLFKVVSKSKEPAGLVLPVEDQTPTVKEREKSARKAVAKATADPDLDGGPKSGKVVLEVYDFIFAGPKTLLRDIPPQFKNMDAAPSPLSVATDPLTLPSNRLDPSSEAKGGDL